MNTHGLRPSCRRQDALPFTIFFLLAITAVCGFIASTGQSSAEASVVNAQGNGGGHVNQRPPEFANRSPEDIAKDFNDDDLKVKDQKPRGKWVTGIESDMDQFNDASLPVAVGAIQSLSGGGKYAGVVKIKRVEIKNKSSKSINSVQLRWEIASLDNRTLVLSEGVIPFVNTQVEANKSLIVEIPPLYPALMLKHLAKDSELNGQFVITIGVQEARFADGSVWRRQESAAGLN